MNSSFFVFKRLCAAVLALVLFSACALASAKKETDLNSLLSESGPVKFNEIWAYLMDKEEAYFNAGYPISDIGYFGAGISTFGALIDTPKREKIGSFGGRVHLVIADNGRALTHFCLDPAYPLRDKLIEDIAEAAKDFDGVQIDFEYVSDADKEHYLSFLSDLKRRIAPAVLSAAIPARTRYIADSWCDYERIAKIADKVIIMAYDEHWSGSEPGPVASMDWCRRVSAYARTMFSPNQLVMGLPFYARAWGAPRTSAAYKYSTLRALMEENKISSIDRLDGVPFFSYKQTVNVEVYFDDAYSVRERASMYRGGGVQNIAFWRLGQEDPLVWPLLSLE